MGKTISRIVVFLTAIALIIGAVYLTKSGSADGNNNNNDGNAVSAVEQNEPDNRSEATADTGDGSVKEDGKYTTAADVAKYIHTYHKLPSNYISLKEAKKKGWKRNECPDRYGFMIGGRVFGNREKLLPKGERYYECDVDYNGKARGVNRLVYTENGVVYHSTDHYKTFERLY